MTTTMTTNNKDNTVPDIVIQCDISSTSLRRHFNMKLTKWTACLSKNNKQLCADIRDLLINHIVKYQGLESLDRMRARVDLKLVPTEAPPKPQRVSKTNTKAFPVDPMFRARNQYLLTRVSRLQDQIDAVCSSTNTSSVTFFHDTLACAHERARTYKIGYHGKIQQAPKNCKRK